jgi:hypothetical protein
MRVLGLLITLAGIFWATIAFKMDTTVTSAPSFYGSGETTVFVPSVTVNNLGKMDERRNHLMFSGLTVLIGVVLLGFSSIPKKTVTKGLRACPSCAELIQPAALKCRYCKSDLPDGFRATAAPGADAQTSTFGTFVIIMCIIAVVLFIEFYFFT